MNQTKPHSRQYQAQQRNIAKGLCAYGQGHSKPVPGHECCKACLDKRRDTSRKHNGSQPYGITGMGRPPLGTPKNMANASKTKKLEQQRDKRLAMIKRAEAKFEAKKAHHMEWVYDINNQLSILGHKAHKSDSELSWLQKFRKMTGIPVSC